MGLLKEPTELLGAPTAILEPLPTRDVKFVDAILLAPVVGAVKALAKTVPI